MLINVHETPRKLPLGVALGSLDSSHNLQVNYAISFLFRLNLILHACKILIRCDSFGILNFASKQGDKVF